MHLLDITGILYRYSIVYDMDKRLQTAVEQFTNGMAVRVFRGFHWRDCADYHHPNLCSDFSRFLVIEQIPGKDGGMISQRSPRRDVLLRAGHAYLIPAGVHFDLFYRRGVVLYSTYMRLDGPLGDDLLGTIGTIVDMRLPAEHCVIISQLAERRTTVGETLLFRSLLISAIAPALTLSIQQTDTRRRLADRYADLLAELVRLPPARASVALLARRLRQPAGTLAKRFRRDVGIALKSFLLDRLRVQMVEIIGTPGSIADIATRLGFADQFYFSRCFKRLVGSSPRSYREQLRSPDEPLHSAV